MNNLLRAIHASVAGGYHIKHTSDHWERYGETIEFKDNGGCSVVIWGIDEAGVTTYEETALGDMLYTPAFWKCLAIAKDWWIIPQWRYSGDGPDEEIIGGLYITEWEYRWLEFVQHIASGESIDSYFTFV